MNFIEKIKSKLTSLTKATNRFPLTTIFLIAAAITNMININSDESYRVYIVTFIVGAFLSSLGQILYERFFVGKSSYHYLLMGTSVLLAFGYYLIIKDTPDFNIELSVRTGVALFAILIAFVWTPSIKRELTFNETFLISFKAYFISFFFSGVIFAGIALILGAIDQLLFSINYDYYSYNATIVFFIFSPLFFLSMIPVYPEKPNEETQKFSNIPKLLEILISYIIIPISAIFTVILIIYIILNIRGDFWSDNLLEPMLVSYSISIILIYVLSSRVENKFAGFFRKIAPKVLVPIVIFQVIASVLKVQDMGITYGRYFAVMYGVYAAVAGIILSFLPVKKNGLIAGLLVIFSIVSIVPPIDAFTISKNSQLRTLENTLTNNEMLENNEIIPRDDVSDEEKEKIINSVQYLTRMDYIGDVSYLPEDFNVYQDFYDTFGFREYEGPDSVKQNIYLNLDNSNAISVEGYDYMTTISVTNRDNNAKNEESSITHEEKDYKVTSLLENEEYVITLLDASGKKIIDFSLETILKKYDNNYTVDNAISLEDASFAVENNLARMKIIVKDISINQFQEDEDINYFGTCYVLVSVK